MAELKKNKKYVSIDYTARDFNSIRENLVNYARRYYPETVIDFSEASFASMMVDTVAYTGDLLSFYLDYQYNESFLASAVDYENVIRLARQFGYTPRTTPSAFGTIALYVIVPANTNGLGPVTEYLPIIKENSIFSSTTGVQFILTKDVRFSDPTNEVVPARIDPNTGVPTSYAIRAYGEVTSGIIRNISVDIGSFQKFRKVNIADPNYVEILSVVDSQGNSYYEVDYLSQDVVFKSESNIDPDTRERTPNVLVPVAAPRRFKVEKRSVGFSMIFGQSSGQNFLNQSIAEPTNILLNRYAREYVTDDFFDPNNLISNESLGIGPENTTLTISYRTNNFSSVNCPPGSLKIPTSPIVKYNNELVVPESVKSSIRVSVECFNEENIYSSNTPETIEEIRMKAMENFSTQSRAVTSQDYESICYHMPNKFGSIKRVRAIRDEDSQKRNINLYVISEDQNGNLVESNFVTRKNLASWINRYKMLNDTIDILHAKVINYGIKFEVAVSEPYNRYEVLNKCLLSIKEKYTRKMFIGESINIYDVYSILNSTEGVSDVVNVSIVPKTGSRYAPDTLNFKRYMSPDGRSIYPPSNCVFELRFPDSDIEGSAR